ncbi:MAG: Holliday junction resolvase RuvX [Acholeplasmataceae bacterium]
MKRYLGLDLGSKTLGVAISTSGMIATGLATYRYDGDVAKALERIVSLIDAHAADVVVLGYPKHMNNDVGVRGQISENLAAAIRGKRTVEVILWDERLSTRSALKAMIEGGVRRQRQKQKKDELAAVLILQNYLDYLNHERKGA